MAALLAFLTLAWSAVAWDLPKLTSPLGPVVNLGYAAYAGNDTSPAGDGDTSVTFFGKIPYAQPPLRELRFRAPRRLDESVKNDGWVDVEDARNFGLPCIQQPGNTSLQSEDCLTLNIWKPSWAKEGDNLPVIMFIYGGGFIGGNPATQPMYDWVHQTGDVIAINFAYRLNLFGFVGGHFVQEDGDLNTGLLDQRAAIEWVKRNIHFFGGDGEQITISGESAGGASVVLQMTAYGGSKGAPFQGAIAQSIGYGPVFLDYEIEGYFAELMNKTGCPLDNTSMSCLRAAPLDTLIKAINNITLGAWEVIIDGDFLPDLVSLLIPQGKFSKVNYIGGHCTNDGRTFAGVNTTGPTDADLIACLTQRYKHLSNATIDALLQFYPDPSLPGSPFPNNYERCATIHADIEFGCMDWYLANFSYNLGQENTYNFRFNVPNPVALAATPYIGVGHGSDVFYLFDGPSGGGFRGFNATEKLVNEELIAYWTSFAKSGNPSTYKMPYSPEWTNWGAGERVVISEDPNLSDNRTASTEEPFTQWYKDRCMFWMVRGNETRV